MNYTVTTGDRLYTDQGSRGELEVGTYAVRLAETTDLTFANLNDQTMQLGLGQGSIRVSVLELPSNNDVEIDTPNGALTVTSPGRYRVDTDPNNDTTVVTVNSGSGPSRSRLVTATPGAARGALAVTRSPVASSTRKLSTARAAASKPP